MKWGGVSIDTSRIKNSDGSTIESRFQTVEAGGGGGSTTILADQTLSAANWSYNSETQLYTLTFSNANISTSSFITFVPSNASVLTVSTCQMMPQIDSGTSQCTFYSQFNPGVNITGTIIIQ